MAMAGRAIATNARNPFSQSHSSLVYSITSLLQTINPINPKDPISPILSQFSPYLNQDLVTQVIKNQTNPIHALFFFNWASNPKPNPNNYYHSHFCYIAITDLLLSHNYFSLATQLLESHKRLSDFMVGKLIKAHGDRGHIRWAVHLFRRVKFREFGCCLFSYNAILGVLVRDQRINMAQAIMGQICKEGAVEPDVSTYTIMIRGFCKMGMIQDAQKVFDEMHCARNSVTYSIMVDGLCKKGLMDNARRIVDRMLESKHCLPDTVTYTTLIDGYCKRGDLDEARRCFEEMARRKCEPNVLTYNAFIHGLCLRGNVDEAKRMMARMRLNGLKDNVATHTSLLKGYCVIGRVDDAIKHLKTMVTLGLGPDVKSYGIVLDGCCKLILTNEATGLLSEMRARGFCPSGSNFNAVLRILVESGEIDRAIHLMKQMPQMGCSPNFLSYNTVILSLVRVEGRMHEVEELLRDMLLQGHELDVTLYSCLVEAYCDQENLEMAIKVFQEMVDKGYVIKLESFCAFVRKLSGKGKVLEAEKFFEQMMYCCPKIDVVYRRVLD